MRRFRRTLCLMTALTAGTLAAATGECTLKGLYEGRLDFGWSTAGIWKDGYVPAADDDVGFPTKPARTMTVRLPSVDGFRLGTVTGTAGFRLRPASGFTGGFSLGEAGGFLGTFRLSHRNELTFAADGTSVNRLIANGGPHLAVASGGAVSNLFGSGMAVKTGAGVLAFGRTSGAASLTVEGGSVAFSGRKEVAAADVLAKATLHLDASDAESLTFGDDGRVKGWRNLAGSGGAVLPTIGSGVAAGKAYSGPLCVGGYQNGLPVLDFGPFCDAAAKDPRAVGSASMEFPRDVFTKTYFIVAADRDARPEQFQQVFGDFDDARWQRTADGGLFAAETEPGTDEGDVTVDGEQVLPTHPLEGTRLKVIAIRSRLGEIGTYCPVGALANFQHRYSGGLRVGEVLRFSERLSDAEMDAVNRYLVGKWIPGGKVRDLDTLVLGAGASGEVGVAAGDFAVRRLVVDGGRLVKTGNGRLLADAVVSPDGCPLAVEVRGGDFAACSAGRTAQAAVAGDVLCHFDASAGPFVFEEGTSVVRWGDVRGNGHPQMEACRSFPKGGAQVACRLPTVVPNALNGRSVVDFGARSSVTYDSAETIAKSAGMSLAPMPARRLVREGFYVARKTSGSNTFPLGSSRNYDFHPGDWGILASRVYASEHLLGGFWTVDGRPVDPCVVNTADNAFHLVHFVAAGKVDVTAFALDRGGENLGGVQLAEAVLYDHELTTEERLATERALMSKWLDGTPPYAEPSSVALSYAGATPASLSVADGETLTVAAVEPARFDSLDVGDGATLALRCGGTSAGALRGSGTVAGDVTLAEGGTITVRMNPDGTVAPLQVDGRLSLPSRGRLVVDCGGWTLDAGSHPILTATELTGALADWDVEVRMTDVKLRRKLSVSGGRLTLDLYRPGFAIMISGGEAPRADAVFVSPSGDDGNVGTSSSPLRTLSGAVAAVRARRNAGALGPEDLATVTLLPGRYPLTEPLVLGPGDSHLAFVAQRAGRAIVDGGVELPRFSPGAGGLWEAQVPPGIDPEQLYVNGRWATRARSPNRFWFHARDQVTEGVDPITGRPADLGTRAFYAHRRDLAPLFGKSAEELRDVVIRHYHSWECSQAHLVSVDPGTGLLIETPSCYWSIYEWRQAAPRYVLENFPEALDEPGEWYFDRTTRTIRYLPLADESLATARAAVPVAEQLVVVRGDRELGGLHLVEDVTFEGLAFVNSAYRLPPNGQASRQASDGIVGAVDVVGGEEIHFRDCRFECLATHGVVFGEGTRHSSLEHSIVRELGGGAVRIGTFLWYGAQESPGRMASHVTVDDCILQRGGRLFPGSVGVIMGMCPNITLTHCDIGDFHYSGVSMGWTWGYAETLVRDNLIAWNHIHHVGWGELSDLGGIYTLGNAAGTQVIGNHIHDVYSYDQQGRGGWGLYTDEGSAGILFASNLVHHVKTGCVHQHYGQDNVFENNVFAYSMENMVQRSRIEDHPTIRLERNILYWDNGTAAYCYNLGEGVDLSTANNVYWSTAGVSDGAFFGLDFAAWQARGQDRGSLVADPLFVDPANGDFRLRPESPAFALGFREVDWTQAGVRGAAWRAEAARYAYPEVAFEPDPPTCEGTPSARLETGFELAGSSGGTIHFSVACPSGGEAFVRATSAERHSGEYALEIHDADCPIAYEPHLFRNFLATNGTVRLTYALKQEEGAQTTFLVRDYTGTSFVGGFSFTVSEGTLRVGSETLPAPTGEWVTVDVLLDLDRRQWTVSTSGDDGRTVTSQAHSLPAAFRRLTWIGFTSNADEPTSWYLDDVCFREGDL